MNNSLVFPGILRGPLDARATTISDEMALAAAFELARCAEERGLTEDFILPAMDDAQVVARVAAATALKAQKQGLSIAKRTREDYIELATRRILRSRNMSRMMTSDDMAEHSSADAL